ncbi:hypothetical protein Taro_013638 [Colocasia esculenta]|uniref:Uncharacterized protein n=1 Tax=Colocasia esculenta TaxID=4460 RepID=A0A843UH17_COLES|nr:hypothetical protein [Colocasia esculenta]
MVPTCCGTVVVVVSVVVPRGGGDDVYRGQTLCQFAGRGTGENRVFCGSCGYALNLSSSNRNTTNFGSKYGKAIRKGVISFFSVDESRFSKSDEYRCIPYISKNSWGLFRRRTKLLCRKCGNHIGVAYDESYKSENSDSSGGNGASVHKKYNIKISALQPSSDESLIPFPYDLCTKHVTSTISVALGEGGSVTSPYLRGITEATLPGPSLIFKIGVWKGHLLAQ